MDLNLGYRHVTIDGLRFWAHPITGHVLPDVRGGAGPDGDDDGNGDGDDDGNEPRTFTQDEVDRMVGRARGEARRTAATDLAEELGCTVDEAKAKIAAAAKVEDDKKTDTDRALEAATTAQAEAERARAEATSDRLTAKLERQLTRAGVDDKALARAVRLLDVDPDADDDAITTEIEALQADVPGLFTTGDDGPPPPPPGIQPPGRKASNGGGKTMAELGQEALRAAGIRTPAA